MSKKKRKQGEGTAAVQPEIAPPEKLPQVIYLGPSLGGDIMLSGGTVYRGELPERVQKLFEKHPELAALFVDVKNLSVARFKLANPKSELSFKYRAIQSFARGGK